MTKFEQMALDTLGKAQKSASDRAERYKKIFRACLDCAIDDIRIKPDENDALFTEMFTAAEKDRTDPVNHLIDPKSRKERLESLFGAYHKLMMRYVDGVPDTAWTEAKVHGYWKELNLKEMVFTWPLAAEIHVACINELKRQHGGV